MNGNNNGNGNGNGVVGVSVVGVRPSPLSGFVPSSGSMGSAREKDRVRTLQQVLHFDE